MIKLFISDIDGCLTEPFKTPEWQLISDLRRLNRLSADDPAIPPLSICSGRPLPYVEAVSQWLDIRVPVIFECGGLYELKENKLHFDGALDREIKGKIKDLKNWIENNILNTLPRGMLEFTKIMDAGFIHPESEVVFESYKLIKDHIDKYYPGFEVHHTEVSVNVILKKNNKKAGIERLCESTGINAEEVAYIGDSGGDLAALKLVGRSFVPENAVTEVKKVAELIPEETTKAVLWAYKKVIEENRNELEQST